MTLALAAAKSPGDWLLSQPQLLFFLLVVVVWAVNAIKRTVAGGAAPPGPASRAGEAAPEGDDDERTRRVREDILRKVTERQLGRAQAERAVRREAARRVPVASVSTPQAWATVEGDQAGREGVQAPPVIARAAPPAAAPAPMAAPTPQHPHPWLEILQNRDGVRKAVIAREILGPPVALR